MHHRACGGGKLPSIKIFELGGRNGFSGCVSADKLKFLGKIRNGIPQRMTWTRSAVFRSGVTDI